MERETGVLVKWNASRHFGFVRADSDRADLFAHGSWFYPGQDPISLLQRRVLFTRVERPDGKLQAQEVEVCGNA